jgi:hypothetical protein
MEAQHGQMGMQHGGMRNETQPEHEAWHAVWTCGLDMHYGHASRACSMGMQHGLAAWTCRMDVQHEDMDMQHGHGYATWTRACNKNMGMQHINEYAAWT